MTLARQIIPGSIYLLTRRCSERRFFLKPGIEVNALFEFLLAAKLDEHGMELLGAVQMSNHYHLVVHDAAGALPKFMRDFNALTARGINHARGRVDGFWDVRQPGVTELCDADAVMDALVYVACNPVKAGLVREGRRWNGLRTSPHSTTERPKQLVRPTGFLRKNSKLPSLATLRVVVPPTHGHLRPEQFAQILVARVQTRETEIHKEFEDANRRFANPKELKSTGWNDSPTTDSGHGGLVPRVSASSKARRQAVLERARRFVAEHTKARRAFQEGRHEMVFPGGTWQAVYVLGQIADPPPIPSWCALC